MPMTAPHTSQHDTTPSLNHLRRGTTYRVTTPRRCTSGEYLGIESPHGDRAILLRHAAGTDSIPLHHVTSIEDSAERASLRAAS
jgi:hypothetical protein